MVIKIEAITIALFPSCGIDQISYESTHDWVQNDFQCGIYSDLTPPRINYQGLNQCVSDGRGIINIISGRGTKDRGKDIIYYIERIHEEIETGKDINHFSEFSSTRQLARTVDRSSMYRSCYLAIRGELYKRKR